MLLEYNNLLSKGVGFITTPFKIGTGMVVEFEDDIGNRLGITDYTDNEIYQRLTNTHKKNIIY